jgi:hypothetical protein
MEESSADSGGRRPVDFTDHRRIGKVDHEQSTAGREIVRIDHMGRVGRGTFTPGLSQIQYVTVSGHTARATYRRLPPSAEPVGLLLSPVGRGGSVEWPAPLAPRALPRFLAPTGQSAPGQRIGTFGLAGPPLEPFPLASPVRFSSSAREPGGASLRLDTGHHRASQEVAARLLPDSTGNPGLDVVSGVAMRHRRFGCPRLSHPHPTWVSTPFDQTVHHHGV